MKVFCKLPELLRSRIHPQSAIIGVLLCLVIPGIIAHAQQKPETFSQLAARAKQASEQNRLDDARRLYTRALAIRPRWKDGLWALGTLEYDQDNYAMAALHLEKLVAVDPANGTAHVMLGLCQFELGKDGPALKNLLAGERLGIVKNEQLRKVALYHLGVLQLRARKFGAAKETLMQVAKDGIKTRELITALGQAALLIQPQGAPPEGSESASVIERAGEAEALLATKQFDQVKQTYAQLLSESSNYPNLHFAYGRLLLEMHEADEAVEEFRRELQRDPKNVNSMLEIAAVRYQVDSQEGLKYAEEAVKLSPRIPYGHYLLGLLRLDTGNAPGAIPELQIAQRAFPKEPRIYFSLGNAYARAGRKTEAARARAEFARLNKEATKEVGSTVYGERPAGLASGQMRSEDRGSPPQ
jgi:tetratricopeptide (TPR) repeat protein